MNRHWSAQQERGSLATLKLILWLAIHLGRNTTRILLYPITIYYFISASNSRRESRAYLQRVLDQPPRWWHIFKHMFYFSCTILDRVYLLTDNHQSLDVRVHNDRALLDFVDNGQGCLLVGAHLGSFEVLRALGISEAKIPLKVLMYKEHNNIITSLLDSLNPTVAETVLPLGKANTLLKVNECLQQGDVIGILGDRAASTDKFTACQFLGSQAVFPTGPITLASILKVPIVLVFGLYRGGNHYDVYFEVFAEQLLLNDRNDDKELQRWAQLFADRLAHYTQESPYNWFNFYDFWQLPHNKLS